jgi:molybdopterin-guanine dinucleotide biosynthesis protein
MKRWSEQTLEERLDNSISHWEKALARVDHDGTALNHDTYDKDPVRFSTATDYQTFVQVLHSIRDRSV